MPDSSVILPCVERARNLAEALRSFALRSFPELDAPKSPEKAVAALGAARSWQNDLAGIFDKLVDEFSDKPPRGIDNAGDMLGKLVPWVTTLNCLGVDAMGMTLSQKHRDYFFSHWGEVRDKALISCLVIRTRALQLCEYVDGRIRIFENAHLPQIFWVQQDGYGNRRQKIVVEMAGLRREVDIQEGVAEFLARLADKGRAIHSKSKVSQLTKYDIPELRGLIYPTKVRPARRNRAQNPLSQVEYEMSLPMRDRIRVCRVVEHSMSEGNTSGNRHNADKKSR